MTLHYPTPAFSLQKGAVTYLILDSKLQLDHVGSAARIRIAKIWCSERAWYVTYVDITEPIYNSRFGGVSVWKRYRYKLLIVLYWGDNPQLQTNIKYFFLQYLSPALKKLPFSPASSVTACCGSQLWRSNTKDQRCLRQSGRKTSSKQNSSNVHFKHLQTRNSNLCWCCIVGSSIHVQVCIW